jgi:ADP-glucose pyrophosphorylase
MHNVSVCSHLKMSIQIKQNRSSWGILFFWQQVDTTILGLPKEEAEKKPYIASMGVYLFKKELLLNLLRYVNSTY